MVTAKRRPKYFDLLGKKEQEEYFERLKKKEQEAEQLKKEYFELLRKMEPEQVYQAYLEKHTRLIPREFVQNHGIGCGLVLRKLPFGPDYKSDFFYFSKSSDDWNAVFIELEKPQSRFFSERQQRLSPRLYAGAAADRPVESMVRPLQPAGLPIERAHYPGSSSYGRCQSDLQ
jgi:hypothetical protein